METEVAIFVIIGGVIIIGKILYDICMMRKNKGV